MRVFLLMSGAIVACAMAAAGTGQPQTVVAWDGSGDFGPQTPGTRTAGWQEAIDHCVKEGRDLYVRGGWGGRKAIYNISDTVRIPATQDFRIDGGVYVLNWNGVPDDPAKDLLVIDSTMNGEYHFGILVYGGAGAAMRIKPEHPVPIDGFAVVIETVIVSQGMADPAPFQPGERKAGTGLVLDGTQAPITCSRFDFIGGILNFKTCVDARGVFSNNEFSCLHLHTNADNSTLFLLGPQCAQNVIKLATGVDMGARGVHGIDLAGCNNSLEIRTRGGFPPGENLIMGESAAGNRIMLMHGLEAWEPNTFLTDNAAKPTNRLTWTGGSLVPITVPAGSGPFDYVQRLFPAVVRLGRIAIDSGHVARGNAQSPLTPPHPGDIHLDVGDTLHLVLRDAGDIRIYPQQ